MHASQVREGAIHTSLRTPSSMFLLLDDCVDCGEMLWPNERPVGLCVDCDYGLSDDDLEVDDDDDIECDA